MYICTINAKENNVFTMCLNENDSINPLREPLTNEKLKTFEGFEKIIDKEAEEIVYSIDTLCHIVYDSLLEQAANENNNHQNTAA